MPIVPCPFDRIGRQSRPSRFIIQGGGKAGELLRSFDWTTSPVGDPSTWPRSLGTLMDTMLASRHDMMLARGAELSLFYNDAYAPFLGLRHPQTLGRPFRELWSEVWNEIVPLVDRALAGEAVWFEDYPLTMHRNGQPEETWWQFSYSPVRGDEGDIVGMLNVASEMTSKVILERQLRAINADREHCVSADRAKRLVHRLWPSLGVSPCRPPR
jgi:PAS domain-containing protein